MKLPKYTSHKKIFLTLFLLPFFSCSISQDNSGSKTTEVTKLKAVNKNIVDSNGNTIILKGINVGQWLVMEGFMSGSNGSMTQSAMKRKLAVSGKTRVQIETYFEQYRSNFIT